MKALVGYTGFVGSNIHQRGDFDRAYNSKNIEEAYGLNPDLLVYAGMRAEKYLANSAPDRDWELVLQAERNIKEINPKRLVLISTIDVLKNPNGKLEDAEIDTDGLQAYGLNRYRLEEWAKANFKDSLIIRLPGLYGINIKKNFIYDYIHRIPFMLTEKKFMELSEKDTELRNYYERQPNGFYQCRALSDEERVFLKNKFESLNFTALNFTDSRSRYQFYPLSRLWSDIQLALENHIQMLHLAVEPVSAGELYEYLTGKEFKNEIVNQPALYDYRSHYSELFGGTGEYIIAKADVLSDIRKFTEEYK